MKSTQLIGIVIASSLLLTGCNSTWMPARDINGGPFVVASPTPTPTATPTPTPTATPSDPNPPTNPPTNPTPTMDPNPPSDPNPPTNPPTTIPKGAFRILAPFGDVISPQAVWEISGSNAIAATERYELRVATSSGTLIRNETLMPSQDRTTLSGLAFGSYQLSLFVKSGTTLLKEAANSPVTFTVVGNASCEIGQRTSTYDIVDAKGRLINIGSVGDAVIFTRRLSSGALDGSFGSNGQVRIPKSANWEQIRAQRVANAPDNKIVGLATVVRNVRQQMVLIRLNENGSLDTTLNPGSTPELEYCNAWNSISPNICKIADPGQPGVKYIDPPPFIIIGSFGIAYLDFYHIYDATVDLRGNIFLVGSAHQPSGFYPFIMSYAPSGLANEKGGYYEVNKDGDYRTINLNNSCSAAHVTGTGFAAGTWRYTTIKDGQAVLTDLVSVPAGSGFHEPVAGQLTRWKNLVRIYYLDFLGRPASDGDQTYWANQWDLISRIHVMASLLGSGESVNRGNVLNRFYTLLLGRTPGQAETDYWNGERTKGVTWYEIARRMITSTEHTNRGIYLE